MEWAGQTSCKFTSSKKILGAPESKPTPHPLYTIMSKRHYNHNPTPEQQFKPCLKMVQPVDHSQDK